MPSGNSTLSGIGSWLDINGTAIYGTRPWIIYGEGPHTERGGMFSEGNDNYRAEDFRFTIKGDALYVVGMGSSANGRYLIKALASDSPLVTGTPTSISLLGRSRNVRWSRTADGLLIQVPPDFSFDAALCFKIVGLTTVTNLTPKSVTSFSNHLK